VFGEDKGQDDVSNGVGGMRGKKKKVLGRSEFSNSRRR